MASLVAPFTGFGDDPATSIKFEIEQERNAFPQWSGGPKLSFHDIANGDDQKVQYHGRTPWRVTWRLWFATLADLEAMDAMQGRPHTLRYLAGLTKTVGGTIVPIDRVRYLVLPDTLLVSLDDEAEDGGTWEATATFQRRYTGTNYLGFVELTEEAS